MRGSTHSSGNATLLTEAYESLKYAGIRTRRMELKNFFIKRKISLDKAVSVTYVRIKEISM